MSSSDRSVSPTQIAMMVQKVVPMAMSVAAKAEPIVETIVAHALAIWTALQPYHPEELVPVILGFVLMVFGGRFLTTIAAVETLRWLNFESSNTR